MTESVDGDSLGGGPFFFRFLTFNSPLSDQRADAVARRLAAARPRVVLEIGCGWGEMLLRVVEQAPGARGLGVDTDERVLMRARSAAAKRGLADRAAFVNRSGGQMSEQADVVICNGAGHAFGDTREALGALGELTAPGGRLLFGEALWDPAVAADPALVWDDLRAKPDLGALVDMAIEAGFRPLWIETSSRDELDAFESGYLADYEEWLLTHSGHPAAERARAKADDHRNRWLRGYRSGFGYAFLTLGRPAG